MADRRNRGLTRNGFGDSLVTVLWVLEEDVSFAETSDLHTTAALLRAFDRAGFEQRLTTLRRLVLADGRLYAKCVPLFAEALNGEPVRFDTLELCEVRGFTFVWVRIDPPITEVFRHALIMLGMVEEAGGPIFVNSPRAICARGSKLFNTRFPELVATNVVTGSLDEAMDFIATLAERRVIVKPLDRAGGTDVECLDTSKRGESEAVLSRLLDRYGFVQLQRLEHAVQSDGEVRHLVFAGEVVASWRKVPAPGDFRANLDQGATVGPVEPSEEPDAVRRLIGTIARIEPGIRFFSADFIGTGLNEINFENVGGLPQADALYRRDHAAEIARRVRRLAEDARPVRR